MTLTKIPCRYLILVLILCCSHIKILASEITLNEFVYEFLESYNQLEGIELVGGEFNLSDYRIEEASYVDSHGRKHYLNNYEYNGCNGFRGLPSYFTVDFCKDGFLFCQKEELSKLNKIIELNANELTKENVPFPFAKELSPSEFSVVKIVNSTMVSQQQDISCVARIEVMSEDRACIYYNETYQSYQFQEIVNANNGVIFSFDGGHWTTPWKNIYGGKSSCPESKFILYGNMPDKKLISLVTSYHHTFPGIKILAVRDIGDDKAIVIEGDLDVLTKWFKNRVVAIALFGKKEAWSVLEAANIYNINNQCFSLPLLPFPLLCEPSSIQLDQVQNNFGVSNLMADSTTSKVLSYVYRMRGVSKDVKRIQFGDPNLIEVTTSNYINTQVIKFSIEKDKWRIRKYSIDLE